MLWDDCKVNDPSSLASGILFTEKEVSQKIYQSTIHLTSPAIYLHPMLVQLSSSRFTCEPTPSDISIAVHFRPEQEVR